MVVIEHLRQALTKIDEAASTAQAGPGSSSGGRSSGQPDDKVLDAEFEDVRAA